MAFIDLGNPGGYVVIGAGSLEVADEIGGAAVGLDAAGYQEWFESTRCGQIAPECGALALANTQDESSVDTNDDFGLLKAS